jgi:hypothetical protein
MATRYQVLLQWPTQGGCNGWGKLYDVRDENSIQNFIPEIPKEEIKYYYSDKFNEGKMDKAGSMMWETRIAHKILFGNPQRERPRY